ncbi:MAG: cation:proton antiporter [Nanoarchaeota archaeon]|nr:cation:proton antiporter [Nanoarchaeota archaeon]
MVEEIFIQLAVILAVAFILSLVTRLLKQPLIIGYIIAGIILSPFILNIGGTTSIIQALSEFGIAFLLFIVGLHMNPKSIKEVGVPSLLIGIGQMIFIFSIGFIASYKLLGLGTMSSVYIGLGVAFSSTIIAVKLISDKSQIDSLYGKISIGVLIVQDIVATIALMVISTTSIGAGLGSVALKSVIGGIGLMVVLSLFGFFFLPKITSKIAKSSELLFLFSITWAFGIAALFGIVGFSVEIGALIAGVLLSVSPYGVEIGAKVRPLRDFFLILFFIVLGLNVRIENLGSIIVPSLILSAIVLVFKPLILMVLSALFGYTKRNNFLVGVTLGQVSEFSLVLFALGVSLMQITSNLLSIITLTAIITITPSSYLTIYSDAIYRAISNPLRIFEKRKVKRDAKTEKKYDVILFGYNRTGFGILKTLREINESCLVVDFNPEIISKLNKWRIPAVYGDAYDVDFLGELPIDKAKVVISTIPEFETNLLLVENIKFANKDAVIIMRAHKIDEALELYKAGADYVLTPHFLGGDFIANMIKQNKTDGKGYRNEREKHINLLKGILQSEKSDSGQI